MSDNHVRRAAEIRRALDELLTRLARAVVADSKKKRPPSSTQSETTPKPKRD